MKYIRALTAPNCSGAHIGKLRDYNKYCNVAHVHMYYMYTVHRVIHRQNTIRATHIIK